MIREFIGARTIASAFMPKKKRKARGVMPSASTLGILAGAGIAYMAMRRNKEHHEED